MAGRIGADTALEAIAIELDDALQGLGCDLREIARLEARGSTRFDN